MGAFSGMSDATRGFANNYLLPGRFVVRVDEVVSFHKEGVGQMWKNSLTVLAIHKGEENHKVGEQVQTFFTLDQRYPKMFFSKIMSFIAGVLGCTDEEIGEAETEEVLAEGSPMIGLVCVVTATESPSKKSKNDDGSPKIFTNYSWGKSLDEDEILAEIGDEGVARFFPNGL